jgi:5-(carboxyamino)imidazole ribonucleotide synthase
VDSVGEVREGFARFGGQPCILERRLPLDLEISAVLARTTDGRIATYPPAENRHVNGILDTSLVPARIPEALAEQARETAADLARAMEYVGTMAVEFFLVGDQLLINELAPRPHNSGHFTLDACITDQFEQQVRAVAGLPLGDPALLSPVVMVNLLGDLWAGGPPDWSKALENPRVKLHLYGKKEPRPGRKMGHLTVLAATPAEALAEALAARERLTTRRQDTATAG